jgi:hypothetical protein
MSVLTKEGLADIKNGRLCGKSAKNWYMSLAKGG